MQHTFLVHFFAVVLHGETSRNFWVLRFMEEMSYVFSFTCFSLQLIFTLHWWPLPFLILSPPLQNGHVVLPTKKCLLCFLALALDLWRPFSRWASLARQLIFSFSLSFSWTLQSILKKKTRIQKHFPLSVFVFTDSLVVSASQDAGGHTLSCQNNLTFGIGLHVVGVRTVVRTLPHNQILSDGWFTKF